MDLFPTNLRTQALAAVRATCQGAETENSAWLWLICGLAAYREGRTDDALRALDQAQFGNDIPATARMFLYRAMALHRAGQTNEAAAALQNAEGFAARTTQQSSGWRNHVFHQLALQELRALTGIPAEPPIRR
jgi:tetratricopeptide (TPR) repeat protein